jgi:hypothetical protein
LHHIAIPYNRREFRIMWRWPHSFGLRFLLFALPARRDTIALASIVWTISPCWFVVT